MKILLRKLQLRFDGAVQVRHEVDNFYGKEQHIRDVYSAYIADYTPFIENGNPTHTLQRDNLQLLKTDAKEQIANWCRKQAEEGGITEVDFEPGYEERDDKALEQLNNEL